MHPRGPSTVLFLIMIVLIAGLLTSCGGGDPSGSGSQKDEAQQNGDAKGQGKGDASEEKMALGNIGFVNSKTERFTVRPSVDEQGKEPIVFKLTPKARITLDGEEVELEDMKKGQQAQVEYTVRENRNLARLVKVFEDDGSSAEDQGDEKTG